jgi:hypothetical protein
LVIFAVSRVGLFILAYFSLILLPINFDFADCRAFPNNLLLDGWTRWDSGWYLNIATHGYSDQPQFEQVQMNVVFFPLYPLSIRVVNLITHNSFLSGILISNSAFAVELMLLYRLICEQYDETTGRWSVVLLATYPFSFYFSAVYSEALFSLIVVGAFYLGQHRRWPFAAAAAAFASATRAVGLTVTLGLLLLYLQKLDFDVRKIRRDIMWLFLGPLGLMLYIFFLYYRFNSPLLFVTARQVPGWEQGMGLSTAWRTITASLSVRSVVAGHYPALNVLHILISLAAVLVVSISWRKLGLAQTLWTIGFLLLSFITGWHGMGRYVLPAFPLYIAVVLLMGKDYRLLSAIVYLNTLLLALFTIMYTHTYWVS